MSPEEELQKIMSLLDDVGIERGDNLGSYTALFRVELLSRIASQQSFALALNKLNDIDNRALLSVTHTANQGGSLVSNDNVIPYQSYPYERIFIHHYQALNYIAYV